MVNHPAVPLKNYHKGYLADPNSIRDTPLVPRGHDGGLYWFLDDVGPRWSEKAQNGFIIGGNYPQRPYGDFWTDSGTILFL